MSDAQLLQAAIKDISRTAPVSLQYSWAQEFGIPENVWRAIADGSWLENLNRQEALYKRLGIDPEEAAKNSAAFLNEMRDFSTELEAIWTKVEANFREGRRCRLYEGIQYMAGTAF
jgi:hypothetical protein